MLSRRLLSLTAGCTLFATADAWAQEVVIDSPPNPDLFAFVDQEFGDFQDFSTYLVQSIVLKSDTFIHEITMYYTNIFNQWPQGIVGARLNIFAQEGNLPGPGDNPAADAPVEATMTLGANGFELTYDAGGDIKLAAGQYWIGLTPILDFGAAGHEWHQGTDVWDKNTAVRNPGGGFGLGTDWFDAGQEFSGIDWGGALRVTGKNVDGTIGPDSFNAFRGFHSSGDLDNVLESDDSDLCYNPGVTLLQSEAPVTLDFTGTLPNDSPASLDVTIEASANSVGLELTISFWNFNTNSWDVVGVEEQSFAGDAVGTFSGNPADHVEPGTGEVRTRYEVRREGPIFLFPWTDCVDHVFWTTS